MDNSRRPPAGEPSALLRPDLAEPVLDLSRHHPRESLRPFVDYVWVARWTLTGPYRQQVLPQPRIHVAAEHDHLLVHGVNRKPFERTFTESGQVVGAAFRAGGFRPFLDAAVGTLEGKVIAAAALPTGHFTADDAPIARRLLTEPDLSALVTGLQDYLEAAAPQADPMIDEVAHIMKRIEQDTGIHRVEQVATMAGVSARTLQRMFTEYVGIAPKWVIQRRRLLDAAEQAHSDDPVDWAALADQLGFSDQAHLVRAFTAAVGTPPATYAKQTRGH
ncbi:AraC family transcriptional regulator [Skermania sp. ID1734]|uniref:helix-turn-helix domain-containing protein n=1 Tax=Skermania sp. ID1734 TaxID=2597516 RepID=UPI00117F7A71|nr:helix-turn-helix domain-containing protein [Skermania sp. ID1734]TSE02069.1 AraC family transcriptional regulator [Skermania sp. ID1734]